MFAFRKIINARFLTYLLTWCIYKCFTTKTFQSHAAEIRKNIAGVHYSLSHWSRPIPAALTIIVTNYVLKTDHLVPRPFTPRSHRQNNNLTVAGYVTSESWVANCIFWRQHFTYLGVDFSETLLMFTTARIYLSW